MKELNKYYDILKQTGLKNTKHRNSVLDILVNCNHPLTVEQIFFALKEKNISINLSSVYRTLECLVAKGLLVKSNIHGDNKGLFEFYRREHRHHLICSECRKIISIEGCPLEAYEKLLQEKTGFDVTGHRLEIYGYCEDCKVTKKF